MDNKHNVIMLTGTINPNVFKREDKSMNVVLVDFKDRLKQYENTIESYILKSDFSDIVFIENSGYEFDEDKFIKMASNVGKHFEFISMKLSDEQIDAMLSRGKSYGEALLIDYAMLNSELIKKSDDIYKVTGRVFLNNSHDIIKNAKKGISEFIVKNPSKKQLKEERHWYNECVITVFFKVNKKDYFDVFQKGVEMCNDYASLTEGEEFNDIKCCIEKVWYELAKDAKLVVKCFKSYPDLKGIIGGKGENYDESFFKIFLRNFLCKIGYYSLK